MRNSRVKALRRVFKQVTGHAPARCVWTKSPDGKYSVTNNEERHFRKDMGRGPHRYGVILEV